LDCESVKNHGLLHLIALCDLFDVFIAKNVTFIPIEKNLKSDLLMDFSFQI